MKKLHLICNAHLDPVWQWTWDEGISAAISTFRSAADLANEFDYIFCHNEALLYEAIEQYAPDLFKEIGRLVKSGKWHIMGGWYLQPDVNIPSGESIIRQILTGRRYLEEKFGVKPDVAINFDSFGHSVGLVQILARSGYRGYIHMRPYDHQFSYPGRFFKWTGPDGSSLIVAHSGAYNSGLGEAVKKIRETMDSAEDIDFVLWGVGNHGGGPSRKDLREIAELRNAFPEVIHSTPEALFDEPLPVHEEVTASLRPSMPGCYSSMARIKQAHRRTENLFYLTEKMMLAAALNGYEPDLSLYNVAQKKFLLAEFHDILPGSCVEAGEREGLGLLATAEKLMQDYRTAAFMYLVMREKPAAPGEYPIFVFNGSPKKVRIPVEAEFSLADQNWSETEAEVPVLYDENGAAVPCQQIKEDGTLNLDWRKRLLFEASLKPFSVTRFSARTERKKRSPFGAPVPIQPEEFLRDCPLLSAPPALMIYEDTADPWGMSDAELVRMGSAKGSALRLMTPAEAAAFCAVDSEEMPPVHRIECGAVAESVEAFYISASGYSRAAVVYRKYHAFPFVDIRVTVEFAEKNRLLRFRIPAPKGKTVGDGPYVIEEKEPCETTFQKWFGREKEDGSIFAVLNDGVHSGTADGDALYLTLLRGAGYLFHPILDRPLYPQDRYLPRIDNGRYTYRFRLFSGSRTEVTEQAELFNLQPYAINVFPAGSGNGQRRAACGISVEGDVTMPSARITDRGEYVFRFYNPSETEQPAKIITDGASFDFTLGKNAIVTVLWNGEEFKLSESPV